MQASSYVSYFYTGQSKSRRYWIRWRTTNEHDGGSEESTPRTRQLTDPNNCHDRQQLRISPAFAIVVVGVCTKSFYRTQTRFCFRRVCDFCIFCSCIKYLENRWTDLRQILKEDVFGPLLGWVWMSSTKVKGQDHQGQKTKNCWVISTDNAL